MGFLLAGGSRSADAGALMKRATVVSGGHPQDPVIAQILGMSGMTSAGVSVSAETAMRVGAVFAAVRVIAETIAMTPVDLYRRSADGKGRARATEHRLYRTLKYNPSNVLNSFQWREMMAMVTVLTGVSYSRVRIDRGTGKTRLIFIPPGYIRPFMVDEDTIAYEYSPQNGQREILTSAELLRVPFMLKSPTQAMSIIESQRETIANALVSMDYANKNLRNDAIPPAILEYDGYFKDKEKGREFINWFQEQTSGSNKGKPVVLEHGIKFTKIALSPEDLQFIEQRKFNVTDIARIFRVPPHMIADMDRATFNNVEQMSIDFVRYSMLPWFNRFEMAFNTTLLSPQEQEEYFFEFNVDALLRGDITTRYRAYSIGRQWGWLSRNDVRERENMDPVEDGDDYLTPTNMTADSSKDPEKEEAGEESQQQGGGGTGAARFQLISGG